MSNEKEILISDADFNRMVKFVQSNYGIDLHAKRQLINSRLSGVLKTKGYDDFKGYVDYLLTKGSGDDINELLSKLTTNYTYFQRETESFDYYVKRSCRRLPPATSGTRSSLSGAQPAPPARSPTT